MGQGILLSGGADVDFMVHGVFSYELFGQTLWITTTHVCVLIVFLIISAFCIAAGHMVKRAKEVPTGFQNVVELTEKKLQTFHTSQIIDYLTKTNQYYLRYQLPNIERHLGSFISMSTPGNPTLGLIGRFFSSFKEELIARIEKDDKIWFPYCMSLSKKLGKEPARTIDGLQITSEQRTEDTIEALLADLKSIMVKHLSGDYDENLCYAVLFSVCSLEKDIKQHNRIRYRILTPMVSAMEKLCI